MGTLATQQSPTAARPGARVTPASWRASSSLPRCRASPQPAITVVAARRGHPCSAYSKMCLAHPKSCPARCKLCHAHLGPLPARPGPYRAHHRLHPASLKPHLTCLQKCHVLRKMCPAPCRARQAQLRLPLGRLRARCVRQLWLACSRGLGHLETRPALCRMCLGHRQLCHHH